MYCDIYPNRAQYLSGQAVTILAECDGPATLEIEIYRDEVCVHKRGVQVREPLTPVEIGAFHETFAGFGVRAVFTLNGQETVRYTAFDVVDRPERAIRYGFLCDFYTKDEADETDAQNLLKLHLNYAQFYDWMYRHEQLLPPAENFTDLMGRELSLRAVKNKLHNCHKRGIRAIAYGAVYAASYAFYECHRDWALCSGTGEAYDFIGKLKIMSLHAELPWRRHIIGEYVHAVRELGFDGIHMDTYGCPKWGFSNYGGTNREEYLETEFPELIQDTRAAFASEERDVALIFNNVGNWPVDTVAAAPQSALYIEVWTPYDRFSDLREIIEQARVLAGEKPIILAAYIKAFLTAPAEEAQRAALLTTAAIVASGAYHLVLGARNGILTQAYYVDYTTVEDKFAAVLRRYCDFVVRYCHLFYDHSLRDVSRTHTTGDNFEYTFKNIKISVTGEPDSVYAIIREQPRRKLMSLLNLYGNDERWNTGKKAAAPVREIVIEIAVLKPPIKVFSISPDTGDCAAQPLDYELISKPNGLFVNLTLSALYNWSAIAVEF